MAHTVSLLGADLPRTLLRAARDNAFGDWETLELVRLDDELLSAASTSWRDPAGPKPAWLQSSAVEDLKRQAADLLRREYGSSPLFVLRDPRICRTIPFWLPVFSELHISPRFVISVRNPLEVAASLEARDEIPEARGLLLWLKCMIDVERETRGQPRVFVRYADFIGDWVAATEDLASRFEIKWPNPIPKVRAEVERFLSKGDGDFRFSDSELRSRPDIAAELKEAYRIIDAAASSRAEPDAAALDAAGAWLDGARRGFGPPGTRALPQGESTVAGQRPNDLEAATQRVAELEATLDALRESVSSLEVRLTGAAREQRRLRTMLVARQMTIDRERSEIAKLSEELDVRDRRLAARDRALEGLQEAIVDRDARLAEQQLTLQAFETSASWRMTAPIRWIKRIILRRPSLQEELLQGGEGGDSARR